MMKHRRHTGWVKRWSEAIIEIICFGQIMRLLRFRLPAYPRRDVVTIILVLIAMTSQATIITVKQDGTGNFTNIQAGINAATNGDTVLVWQGIYFENINYNSKSITVASLYLVTGNHNYINTTIIDGANNGSCVYIYNCTGINTTLNGFTLQQGSGSTILKAGGGVYVEESILSIRSCVIRDCLCLMGGGIMCQNSNVFLSGTIVKNNIALYKTGGILIANNSEFIFDTQLKNSVYLNYGPIGCDISKTISETPQHIILDTGSVLLPDNHFFSANDIYGYPLNNITWEIENAVIEQINADLYVSSNGDNNNSGLSPDQPLKSLAFAIKKILPNTINPNSIFLAPGIYSPSTNGEIFPIITRSYVSIIGSEQENTVIDAEQLYPLLDSYLQVKKLSIQNITFKRGIDSHEIIGGTGGMEFYDNDSIYIQNITITQTKGRNRSALNSNLTSISINNSHILSNSGGYPLVLGNTGQTSEKIIVFNTIVNFNGPGITYEDGRGGAVGLFGSYSYPYATSGILINLLINENTLTFEPGAGDKAICGLNCSVNVKVDLINTTIANNIVTNPVPSGQVYASEGAEVNFYNSIVYGTENYEIFLGDGQPTSYVATINLSNTDVKGGEANIQNWNNIHNLNWLDGNIDQNPLWEGGDPFSYALQPGSPCINVGTPMYLEGMDYPYIKEENGKYILYMLDGDTVTLPATDLAGNPRISGGRIDMGAYEWQDTTTKIPNPKFQKPIGRLVVYPNPFVSNVFVSFSTEKEQRIEMQIIDMNGQEIKKIISGKMPAGNYRLVWDGKDDSGFDVKPGYYLICFYSNGKLTSTTSVAKNRK